MKSFMMGLLGVGVGLSLGMLFAPMRGEEMRQTIRDRAEDVADNARGRFEQARNMAEKVTGAIRGDAGQSATGTEG